MSQKLIGHSSDLKRLRDEGYDVEIRSSHLLVKDVPYVNSRTEVKRGILVSTLALAGDRTTTPDTHVVHFVGEHPCRVDGTEIDQIKNASGVTTLAEGLVVDHMLSAKPNCPYPDYYAKMTHYVTILSGFAEVVEPGVTAKTFRPIQAEGGEEVVVFAYVDTASSRAEITSITEKLAAVRKVAIVGLGGTGAYVLDLVAKTPVAEIHLYDGDAFLQHNAFRSPGAASIEELDAQLSKPAYFGSVYAKMHNGIVTHEVYVGEGNVDELKDMDFVFLCLEGSVKELLIERLEAFDTPFIDVGMGVYRSEDSLGGIVRVTASTPAQRDHVRRRISFSGDADRNEYEANIQIADLNALNASLAVIRWKKLLGFYQDLEHEYHCTYTIGGNKLLNEDQKP
jgi:hypothetical protein